MISHIFSIHFVKHWNCQLFVRIQFANFEFKEIGAICFSLSQWNALAQIVEFVSAEICSNQIKPTEWIDLSSYLLWMFVNSFFFTFDIGLSVICKYLQFFQIFWNDCSSRISTTNSDETFSIRDVLCFNHFNLVCNFQFHTNKNNDPNRLNQWTDGDIHFLIRAT